MCRDLVPFLPSVIGEGDGAVQVRNEHGSLNTSVVVKPVFGECCERKFVSFTLVRMVTSKWNPLSKKNLMSTVS